MNAARPQSGFDAMGFTSSRIAIPAGSFLMGSDSGQDNEKPIHRVSLDAFLLAACQVTNAEYARFLYDNHAAPTPFWTDPNFSHPEQAVVGVSWFEAVRYCEWLSACTGQQFRLPTEAEWEYAARGGRESARFPWGDEPPESRAGYAERWKTGPEPVGQSEANGFGLFNMCDNVHEWCSDWFEVYPTTPQTNPTGAVSGSSKVYRGGGINSTVNDCRSACRSFSTPSSCGTNIGFRVVVNVQ